MKQTDMELQAIREKLQLLQAEPPAAETLASPWSQPVATSVSGVARPTAKTAANQSPQEIAIETLKQRSRGHDPAASARLDSLVSQEIYRLEVQAHQINERSAQQATDIMALKRSAQQASVGLRRQGVHDHPQLAAITQFLDQYTSAAVPHIERATNGHFTLRYNTIDFHQAQQDAIETANVLRSRGLVKNPSVGNPLHTAPFSHPIAPAPVPPATDLPASGATNTHAISRKTTLNQSLERSSLQMRKAVGETVEAFSQKLKVQKRRRRKQPAAITREGFDIEGSGFREGCEEGVLSRTATHEFTWLDGTIWFSGAAIAQIVLQPVVASQPIIFISLMLGLVGMILFALYQVVMIKTTDYTLVYRLCISLIGVFLAGLF